MRRVCLLLLLSACAPKVTPVAQAQSSRCRPAVPIDAPVVALDEGLVIEPPGGSSVALEPSGLALVSGKAAVVAEGDGVAGLYRLEPVADRRYTVGEQQIEMGAVQAVPWGAGARADGRVGFDYEGLDSCGAGFAIVEESESALVRADLSGVRLSTEEVRIPGASRWGNAGLEGVACADDGRLWFIKERSPRVIYRRDPGSDRVTAVGGDLPGTEGANGVYQGLYPDFSGAYYEAGHLYVLERLARRVLKLDANTLQVLDTVFLDLHEDELYDGLGCGAGLAEGLSLEPTRIMVVLDNGTRTTLAGVPGHRGALLLAFERPPGF